MDKRQQKTRATIIKAFNQLLISHNYNSITVQQIIDQANIGRSTFYAHFETKDMLLLSICADIFAHIFSTKSPQQSTIDPMIAPKLYLQQLLAHILFHLKASHIDIYHILKSESEKIFLEHFRTYIKQIFSNYTPVPTTPIPQDFYLNFLVDSFTSTVAWWILSHYPYTAEEMATYYIDMVWQS